ncbi:MAG: hypothetical protein SOZ46_09870 [Bullifex sp.]|nr:hypothetical protein [Bullifex sp.]
MKRTITFLLVIMLTICSAFASGQLFTFGFESGWNNGINGPLMGFHTFYHFGASVNNKTTVGFGTLADVDFGLRRFSSGDYDANMALGFGPSFVTDVDTNITINGMVGPLFEVQKSKYTDDSALGLGVGGTFAVSLIPTAERRTRNPLGFTFGVIASATLNVDEGPAAFFSCKAFFGLSTLSPFYAPYLGYDIYDDILMELYDAY